MTKDKIILGFNGTAEGRDALRLAAGLANAKSAEIIPVASYDVPTLPGTVTDADPSLFSGAEQLAAEIDEKLPGHDVRLRIAGASSPARALHDVAEAEAAETIVIGSTHRAGMGRVVPGSVGERLLHGAPCEVAIAPRGYARGEHYGLGLIGVGFDGGDESRRALASARRLAVRLGAKLRLIGVLPEAATNRRDEFRTRLEEAAEFARLEDGEGRRVEAEAVLTEGNPSEVLADEGIELDLLVIGSRGYGPVLRTVLGGVSDRVIRIAPCPVLVVPRGERHSPITAHAVERLFAAS